MKCIYKKLKQACFIILLCVSFITKSTSLWCGDGCEEGSCKKLLSTVSCSKCRKGWNKQEVEKISGYPVERCKCNGVTIDRECKLCTNCKMCIQIDNKRGGTCIVLMVLLRVSFLRPGVLSSYKADLSLK